MKFPTVSLKLRDLIRKVRACKTAAEERAVIAKESAMIRTAIREEQAHFRHRNVAKLLFMHMLGYPTHFGQLECIKLIASNHFPEKRIGYLGMMLLLSEQADVLMLATNALKNDLNSDNKFVSGLALCAIGNLATSDMSRDLAPEVDKHLKSSQPYLRKKACLAMARCLTKCPEMVEDFVDRVVTLLKDRSHGVLISVVQLMTQVLIVEQMNQEMGYDEGYDEDYGTPCQDAFIKLVPSLVKLMRNVIGGGYAANDAGGVSDVFLQTHVLTLLRLLGAGNEAASEEMNDVLAQVATNTETSKNSGNAILYECVQTIMGVESDDGLRVLAVNILGRFLLNRDNNIRYVALNTLSKCVMEEKRAVQNDTLAMTDGAHNAASALQKHRNTIVDCLKDPDVSIRQRALELIYHLVNSDNVETLTAELLNYLVLCPRENRSDICTRILRVVEKYSPNDRWRVDTLITMLTIAGRESARAVQSASIIYISRTTEDIRAYATHKLLKAIRDDDGTQKGLLVVGIWCIGEYGDLLMKPYNYTPSSSTGVADLTGAMGGSSSSVSFAANDAASIVATIEEVIDRHMCPEEVKQHSLTAFTKLSERFANSGDSVTLSKLQELVQKNSKSHVLELQLRSCEYDALINAMKGVKVSSGDDDIFGAGGGELSAGVVTAAKEALARMPVVDISVMQKQRTSGYGRGGDDDSVGGLDTKKIAVPESNGGGDLEDLEDIFGGGDASSSQPMQASTSQNAIVSNGISAAAEPAPASDMDLLSDIFSAPTPVPAAPSMNGGAHDPFGAVAPSQPQPPAAPIDAFAPTPMTNGNGMMNGGMDDILGAPAPVAPPAPENIIVPACSHGGLFIEFECTKPEPMDTQKSTLVAKFKNTNNAPIHGLNLQCAVPKYVIMEMTPPTSTTVPVSGVNGASEVTQTITVTNKKLGEKNLMLKLKLGFTANGAKVDHMATVSGFPAGQF
uniref:AP-1 complex subunit gamma n=1 Tax=Chaetoceros debilis TaxID=122233 RepID=A0A7S3VAG3_9STRA